MAVTKRTLVKNLDWLKDQDIKGKGYIKFVYWLNTVKHKYEEGDIVIFSAPGHRMWEQRVEHKVGKIVKIRHMMKMYDKPDEQGYGYTYEIEATFKDARNTIKTSFYIRNDQEDRLIEKKIRKLTDNFIKHPVDVKSEQEVDVII